ncbi:DUF664 domain-containing protein [Ammonicoccus fulvus]|uniref:DUF664 domain-containing protein n=1 Tax=Ammonicoccus fulvus TaxID=3138240 RepID=A0ABZ3FM98_9ACTN
MQDSTIGRFCLLKLDEMIVVVGGLDDRTANTVPDFAGANSAYQLLLHTLGMLRQWTQSAILGRAIERDREAEFTAVGEVGELIEYAGTVRAEFVAALGEMHPDLDVPGREGFDDFWATSTEGILIHVFEEICQHLGHLEITRDLVSR